MIPVVDFVACFLPFGEGLGQTQTAVDLIVDRTSVLDTEPVLCIRFRPPEHQYPWTYKSACSDQRTL